MQRIPGGTRGTPICSDLMKFNCFPYVLLVPAGPVSGSSEDKPIRPFRLQRNSNSLCVAHGGNPIKMQMMIGMEEVGAEFRYRKIVAHP